MPRAKTEFQVCIANACKSAVEELMMDNMEVLDAIEPMIMSLVPKFMAFQQTIKSKADFVTILKELDKLMLDKAVRQTLKKLTIEIGNAMKQKRVSQEKFVDCMLKHCNKESRELIEHMVSIWGSLKELFLFFNKASAEQIKVFDRYINITKKKLKDYSS